MFNHDCTIALKRFTTNDAVNHRSTYKSNNGTNRS